MNRHRHFARELLTSVFLFGVAVSLWDGGNARAEVVAVEVRERVPFAEGKAFGHVGAYEILNGRLYFATDPTAPGNERVTDIELAPRNAEGKVEWWADFSLLKPVEAQKGNGCLLYDVHNRGNKLALWTFNEGERSNDPRDLVHAGNGFLFREGYSILWTGWNGDVLGDGTNRLLAGLPVAVNKDGTAITGRTHVEISVDEPASSQRFFWSPWGVSDAYPTVSLDPVEAGAELVMRPERGVEGETVPTEQWAFARWENGEAIPDPKSLYLKDGFRPGWVYDLYYTARDPRVSGLGLAGLRDAVSFFRYGESASEYREGQPTGKEILNTFGKEIDRAVIFGISQSGRLIHHFLYEGLNLDLADRRVFDGALIHVAGAGKGLFNARFGMATVYGTFRLGNLSPADSFPFAPVRQIDPITGQEGDTLARLREKGDLPKIFFVQTSTEYWARAASLLHTDVEGKRDVEPDPDVRIYHIAGTQHLGGSEDPSDKGVCRHFRNPVKHRGPVLRALLVALDEWIVDRETFQPPPSRHPRIDDGTLVDRETFRDQWPEIPGVGDPAVNYQPLRLDFGQRWKEEGIADRVPPGIGKPYRTLVPAVDADGNEVAGIRLPEIAVALGTATGWNLRADEFGAGGLPAGLHGGWFPFPTTAKEHKAGDDPRPSVEERYPDRDHYFAEYTRVALELQEAGFLLAEDVVRLLEEARERP